MERILFARIELWVVALLAVLAVVGAILFGAVVLDEERGKESLGTDHFGRLGDVALAIAEVPENARQTFKKIGKPDPTMMALFPVKDASQPTGWDWQVSAGQNGLDGYLLLSRHDGDLRRHVIELVSLTTGEIVRQWQPDAEALLATVERRPEFEKTAQYQHWNNGEYRFIHPYLTRDGQLVLRDHHSPLFLVSPCGDPVWHQDEHLFHHSTEPAPEGGFWMPSYYLPPELSETSDEFVADALARVDMEGKVVFKQSAAEIFLSNGLQHLLFPASHFFEDPMHLNDIEPVPGDGPYWKAGDLFLSFRSPSLVMLYRPSTGRIIWQKAGPWISQHDVDVIDDHRIAIFNNNAYDRGRGARVFGASETVIYDFDNGEVTSPFAETFRKLGTATISEGLQSFTPSGHLIFEEENRGRIFILDQSGNIVATFLNRATNGEAYRLGWSRYIPQDHGEAALNAINGANCE